MLEARPLCPHCGGTLSPRTHGDMLCVQHGLFFPPEVLDQALGAGHAQRAQTAALHGPTIGRRCPRDRLAMNSVTNASGRVRAEACQRCGSMWLPSEEIDKVAASTPAPAGVSPADARSLLGFAAIRSVLAPPPGPPSRSRELLRR